MMDNNHLIPIDPTLSFRRISVFPSCESHVSAVTPFRFGVNLQEMKDDIRRYVGYDPQQDQQTS